MRTIIHQIDSLVLNRGGGGSVNSKPLLLRRKVANSKYVDLIVTLFGEGRGDALTITLLEYTIRLCCYSS